MCLKYVDDDDDRWFDMMDYVSYYTEGVHAKGWCDFSNFWMHLENRFVVTSLVLLKWLQIEDFFF